MKKLCFWISASALVMLVFPWLTVTFVKGCDAMAVCFILFYAVNPIYSFVTGVFAGKAIKDLWPLPIITAFSFLIGTWAFFDLGESAFILYASVYLVIGIAAMLFSTRIGKKPDSDFLDKE